RYTDDYTVVTATKTGFSKMSYSFIIGIVASLIAYLVGIPLGILMSRNQDKLLDKIGTLYIVFIIAVPSLAYIFMFRAIGMQFGWPTTFSTDPAAGIKIYFLPIISGALPAIGGLMKWTRRYMIDQKNSDYVKFARSGGLSEGEIFRGHILKNAMIIIVHSIPGSILGSLVGGIITERVYTVPGTGGMLVNAITAYDNAAIVGLAMFYAMLSVLSLILGDILMAMIDPRISFSTKGR
ncbi:MAG: ABC transporter permease, partial [Clostridia bacterium]|nr:ABC transporter permease [Clostridia bacterium]